MSKSHPKQERTLVIIKPDGVHRSLIGDIVRRYERLGLKLVGLKMAMPTAEHVERHYTLDEHWKQSVGTKTIESYKKKGQKPPSTDPIEIGNRVLKGLVAYLTSGPVVAMCLQGAHAVELGRKLAGSTEPLSSDVGTIRGDYVLDSYAMADADERAIRNLVHASGSVEEATNEIDLWFDQDELTNYKLAQEQILYDVDLDCILE